MRSQPKTAPGTTASHSTSPSRHAGDDAPRPLPDEVRQEQQRRHLARDGEAEHEPGGDVAAAAIGSRHAGDEEQDEDVDVVVRQVAERAPAGRGGSRRP